MTFRIVFMGSQDFSNPCLEKLVSSGFQVEAVVTQPDRPAGRGRKLRPTPVKGKAVSLGRRILEPESVRSPALKQELENLRPDFIVVAAYGGILPLELIQIPLRGCLGVHPSLLPRSRGSNPIRWTLIRGESKTGISIFQLEAGVDTGKIILQKEEPVLPQDNFGSLEKRLARTGAEALVEALRIYARGQVVFQEQADTPSSAPQLSREQERIDWFLPAETISNWIRALSPRPGAFTWHSGQRLKILASRPLPGPRKLEPGTLLDSSPGQPGIQVACGEGCLELLQVQLEGGKPLPVPDFLRGHRLKAGEKFIRDAHE